jgi:hypothetical protein
VAGGGGVSTLQVLRGCKMLLEGGGLVGGLVLAAAGGLVGIGTYRP